MGDNSRFKNATPEQLVLAAAHEAGLTEPDEFEASEFVYFLGCVGYEIRSVDAPQDEADRLRHAAGEMAESVKRKTNRIRNHERALRRLHKRYDMLAHDNSILRRALRYPTLLTPEEMDELNEILAKDYGKHVPEVTDAN